MTYQYLSTCYNGMGDFKYKFLPCVVFVSDGARLASVTGCEGKTVIFRVLLSVTFSSVNNTS